MTPGYGHHPLVPTFYEPQPGLILESVEPLEALEVGLPLSQASDRLHLLVDPGEHELGCFAELALAGVDEADPKVAASRMRRRL